MSEFYDEVIADTQEGGANWLLGLDRLKAGSQGVQGFLGYSARWDDSVASAITENMSDGVGAAFLNSFSADMLNNQTEGIRLNPEVLQYFPTTEPLGLEDDKHFQR